MARRRKRRCFFISPIGKEDSTIRDRSDWILETLLKPALGDRYELIRSDQESKPGSITVEIIRLLDEADLVVADLTGLNANVVYELGVRHAINKPAIQIMDQDQTLPFDLYGERTIFFKHDKIRSVQKARTDLLNMARQTERADFTNTSPVSRAIDVVDLHASPVGKRIASILEEIIHIKKSIDDIATEQFTIDLNVDNIESDISSIKDALETLAPD